MASSSPPPPSQQPPSYFCHHCSKHVSVQTHPDNNPPNPICSDCHSDFVELIPFPNDQTTLASQFINVLRLLSHVSHDSNLPSPPSLPPPPAAFDIDIEDGGLHNADDNDNDNDDDDDESVRSVEIEGDSDDDDDVDAEEEEETEDEIRRRIRRETLRRHLREFATRSRSGRRNRILDWAEILMGLENNSIELRFEVPESDRYVGNPGDYVNEAEYEALLKNLAEEDGKRGAPPASKAAVEMLKVVEVKEENECFPCAICKDGVGIGENVKEMPCGHGYHGECIVTWLGERNSCPVCRFELVTDDVEYEEEKKRNKGCNVGGSDAGSSSSVDNSS